MFFLCNIVAFYSLEKRNKQTEKATISPFSFATGLVFIVFNKELKENVVYMYINNIYSYIKNIFKNISFVLNPVFFFFLSFSMIYI